MPDKGFRISGLYGGARLGRMKVELTTEHLNQLGDCIVKIIAREAKIDFAKRGWSGRAYDGSAPIWDSFGYRISGERTIEVVSTFPRLATLTGDGVPPHEMEWLTQTAKKKSPQDYGRTEGERRRGMNQTGDRMPLVVPIKSGGTVIFRTAPLRLEDAWVHPGIARFTFIERAKRKIPKECAPIFGQACIEHLVAVSRGRR